VTYSEKLGGLLEYGRIWMEGLSTLGRKAKELLIVKYRSM
jgi:hypothetical protein